MVNDPRLQWRQLNQAQPNVAGLMAQVRGGINDAGNVASSILERYQSGQEQKAETELVRRIGGMDQEQLRSAFESGTFDDLNLGANGVDILNNAMAGRANIRSTNVNSDRTQASIGWGNDANSRANSAEGRTATRFGWEGQDRADSLARRDWQRDNAGLFIEGEENAFSRGLAPASLVRTESGGNFAARNDSQGAGGKGHFGRVQFGRARFDEAKAAGAVPQGMSIEEFGQNTQEARNAQIQAENWHFGEIQDRILDAGLDRYIGQTVGGVEITRDGMVAMAHLGGFGGMRRYLESNGSYNPADDNGTSLRDYARTHAGNTSGPQQGGFQPTTPDRGGSEYAAAMAASGLFTGAETLGAIDPIRAAAEAGQAVRDEQLTEFQNDVLAGVVEQVASSPNVLNSGEAEAVIRDLLREQGDFSASEVDRYSRRGSELITSSEALSGQMTGGQLAATTQGAIEESAANTIAAGQRTLEGQDQYRALNDIQRFSPNPTESLEQDLGIPSDPETRGDYRSEFLRRHINELADKFGVEPAVVAVAMRDAFIPDPGERNEGRWWDIDLTRNTIANRFDEKQIEDTVKQLSPERQADFARLQSNQTIRSNQLNQNAQQQIQVERRLQKAIQQGDSATAERMQQRLKSLKDQAAAISTSEILQSSR